MLPAPSLFGLDDRKLAGARALIEQTLMRSCRRCSNPLLFENSDEMFDIMNLLEDRLRHNNSAVVLGAVRLFLLITLPHADVHQQARAERLPTGSLSHPHVPALTSDLASVSHPMWLQVYERIKTPLLTLAASCAATPEVSYAVWGHLHLLVLRAPVLFSNDYKQFFCRASDSFAVKALKLEMLTVVADNNNTCGSVCSLNGYRQCACTGILPSRACVREFRVDPQRVFAEREGECRCCCCS